MELAGNNKREIIGGIEQEGKNWRRKIAGNFSVGNNS
jgi:hypothetical protein